MDNQAIDNPRKRKSVAVTMEGKEREEAAAVNAAVVEVVETDDAEEITESEDMKHELSCIVDKIESFTQLVSELLEFGKKLFKDLSDEFEDRIIMIHKERIDKWQEEMRELRLLDASNEEIKALVQKAQYLLHSIQGYYT